MPGAGPGLISAVAEVKLLGRSLRSLRSSLPQSAQFTMLHCSESGNQQPGSNRHCNHFIASRITMHDIPGERLPMTRANHLIMLAVLAFAPDGHAQVHSARLSADGSCPAPRTQQPPNTAAPAPATIAEPLESEAKPACSTCDDGYHMPAQWHRFLPGMFR